VELIFPLADAQRLAKLGLMLADQQQSKTIRSATYDAPVLRLQCHFSGRVQGVGFRYTVKNIALGHDVLGYVRNLRDGRVELVMEGSKQEMDQVIENINSRMNGYIKNLECTPLPPTGEFDHFQIKH
jgi:acylphosphatase